MKLLSMVLFLGSAGSVCRYLMTVSFSSCLPGFSCGTLFVNLSGAFLAGFVFVLFRSRFSRFERYEPVCLVGFMGGFTTFSSYALDSMRLIASEKYTLCIINIAVMNVLGLLSAYVGMAFARRMYPYRRRRKQTAPEPGIKKGIMR